MRIDLHAHILPGIDDGPRTLAEALELARVARSGGTHLMAATPHVRPDHPAVRPDELADRCAELGAALDRAGIDLVVVPGAEVDLAWAVGADDDQLAACSYGQVGTDLLVETPRGALGASFEDFLWSLAVRGYRIILAHPERNPTFQSDPGRLLRLAHRGTLMQLSAMSLTTTRRGSGSRRLARLLLERGAAHVIASDAHAAQGPRGPGLQPALTAAAALDQMRTRWMAEEVPAAILAGEQLPPAPPMRRRHAALRPLRALRG